MEVFKHKKILQLTPTAMACEVEQYIGGGGQGEVYSANVDGRRVALKWYFSNAATQEQRSVIEELINRGSPSPVFLWPESLVESKDMEGFGYIMPLLDTRFKGIVDLMKKRITPSFKTIAIGGLRLSHNFLLLHSKGLCYRDISFGNVFFDPDNGDIRICDNDNVGIDDGGIAIGTQRFMAPEVVQEAVKPNTQSDLFSLSVLLFYMLFIHHPLEGQKESDIKCLDIPAMKKLYGTDATFIFDPNDDSNRPVKGQHDNALIYWAIYPDFLKRLFTRAFTNGIRDPKNGRIRENEWRSAMSQLVDAIFYCPGCGSENFYDKDALKNTGEKSYACWSCQRDVVLPYKIRIDRNIVMLNHDTKLYPHHIDIAKISAYDLTAPVAEVNRHPQDPNIWGLKNLSPETWMITTVDGTSRDVHQGQSVTIVKGTKIRFGSLECEITH